jgi:lipoprotein-releasing system ATP-binding protein
MNGAKLCLQGVEKFFIHAGIRVEILKKTTVLFQQGISYAIVGASGVGKSTLMHILSGLESPNAGDVLFNSHIISGFTAHEKSIFLNQSIGLVFQQPYLIRELSVLENVMVPGLLRGQSSVACKDRAQELLAQVDLTSKCMSKVSTLSGGQQQRVALARALFNRPQFLLADEPTGSLDANTGKLIVELLGTFQKEYGMGIIVSTHDMQVAAAMDQIYCLQDGNLIVSSHC